MLQVPPGPPIFSDAVEMSIIRPDFNLYLPIKLFDFAKVISVIYYLDKGLPIEEADWKVFQDK